MAYNEDYFRQRREQLVEFMRGFSAKSESVRKAFLAVKRELFVPEEAKPHAYADEAMPIGHGQTISQPSTIAVMLELLDVKEGMKVLEVGSGCGYVSALLSEMVGAEGKVFGIELVKELAEMSMKNLKEQGCKNTEIMQGDGCLGLPKEAPFDRILISAACPYVPKPLFDQLREKGKIVAPVGDKYAQIMETMTKANGKPLKEQYLGSYFIFVPLKCRDWKW